ncbi:metalloregulator ArsR/SmtB family transcription factor [Salipiger sp. PrR003]|uniref:ArsR/SmtB family transcription factor n=1 Tax=Salipiger sp. PrR003 TaxID=2706776 RepID=UPI0013DB9531|nr:metalloregulator ArsR/SmtB family transcription factor [Salipiger sp. PrR003]NDV50754.1 helix-turn-helix transcriptional regulator [Salipiger sp. PrR003]
MSRNVAEATSFLKSIAHEQRLLLLCHLCAGEKSVGELMREIGVSQSATSQMLARLREDGLVRTRRDGKKVYYRLAAGDTARLIDLLHRIFCDKRISQPPARVPGL